MLSKTLLSPVAPLSFSLPVCAVGQVGLWISDYKSPGVSESQLWGFACSLQRSPCCREGLLNTPGTDLVGCGTGVGPGGQLRVWPLRAEQCWLLPEGGGVWGPGTLSLSSPPPWEQCCCEPDLSLHKLTPSSVLCRSLSPSGPCQEPRGSCVRPNPHPPGWHLGGFLEKQDCPDFAHSPQALGWSLSNPCRLTMGCSPDPSLLS